MRMSNSKTFRTVRNRSSVWQLHRTTLLTISIRLMVVTMVRIMDRVYPFLTVEATTGEGTGTGVADIGAVDIAVADSGTGRVRYGLWRIVHHDALLGDSKSSFAEAFAD